MRESYRPHQKACTIHGCARPVHARRRCRRHYEHAWHAGQFTATPHPPKLPLPPAPAEPPAWMARAACLATDPDVFFPGPGRDDIARAAKAVCATCPVRAECLNFGFAIGADFGIFGDMTARERRALLRGGKAA